MRPAHIYIDLRYGSLDDRRRNAVSLLRMLAPATAAGDAAHQPHMLRHPRRHSLRIPAHLLSPAVAAAARSALPSLSHLYLDGVFGLSSSVVAQGLECLLQLPPPPAAPLAPATGPAVAASATDDSGTAAEPQQQQQQQPLSLQLALVVPYSPPSPHDPAPPPAVIDTLALCRRLHTLDVTLMTPPVRTVPPTAGSSRLAGLVPLAEQLRRLTQLRELAVTADVITAACVRALVPPLTRLTSLVIERREPRVHVRVGGPAGGLVAAADDGDAVVDSAAFAGLHQLQELKLSGLDLCMELEEPRPAAAAAAAAEAAEAPAFAKLGALTYLTARRLTFAAAVADRAAGWSELLEEVEAAAVGAAQADGAAVAVAEQAAPGGGVEPGLAVALAAALVPAAPQPLQLLQAMQIEQQLAPPEPADVTALPRARLPPNLSELVLTLNAPGDATAAAVLHGVSAAHIDVDELAVLQPAVTPVPAGAGSTWPPDPKPKPMPRPALEFELPTFGVDLPELADGCGLRLGIPGRRLADAWGRLTPAGELALRQAARQLAAHGRFARHVRRHLVVAYEPLPALRRVVEGAEAARDDRDAAAGLAAVEAGQEMPAGGEVEAEDADFADGGVSGGEDFGYAAEVFVLDTAGQELVGELPSLGNPGVCLALRPVPESLAAAPPPAGAGGVWLPPAPSHAGWLVELAALRPVRLELRGLALSGRDLGAIAQHLDGVVRDLVLDGNCRFHPRALLPLCRSRRLASLTLGLQRGWVGGAPISNGGGGSGGGRLHALRSTLLALGLALAPGLSRVVLRVGLGRSRREAAEGSGEEQWQQQVVVVRGMYEERVVQWVQRRLELVLGPQPQALVQLE
ncbi:hypothetical protein CHLRE_03g209617v5 [Chlamydomonas reinhardtii]|uniref:Uncharacterized protein n=1 Tax=Chlamydomonas reinhardtii TaxID=3055 RepID=A0A2K3DZX4_CHLRE|nr:uncharacterized protein CHLRE_03g209617v5 [Chlamydomonas reinhardtii]PNW86057.1 hypothetical protein CHLRE_03g209617v5 [Chlamydomonas reinhardtii]